MITEEMSQTFNDAFLELEKEQEAFWNGLSEDEQLSAFCAISRRLFDGEIENRRSYRGILYDVMGFGPGAYVPAQVAGFLELHNSIFTKDQLVELITNFVNEQHLSVSDDQISDFIRKRHL
jgi:hypothetical protein